MAKLDPSNVSENIKNKSSWKRILHMAIYFFFYFIGEIVLKFLILFQAFHFIITGAPNEKIKQLSAELLDYLYNALKYLGFHKEKKIFPFN